MKLNINEIELKVVVAFICIIVFAESYLDTSIFIIACMLILGIRFIRRNFRIISLSNLCVLSILLGLIISVFILPMHSKTIMIIAKSSCLLWIEFFLEREEQWSKKLIKTFRMCAFIFVIMTLFQSVFPTIIENINNIILSEQGVIENKELYRNGAYAGITNQTGRNSFYISLYILIIFIDIYFQEKKKYGLLIIGIVALWLTAKRGPLVFCFLSIIAIIVICSKNASETIRLLMKYIIFIIIGITVLYNIIPSMKTMIEKLFNVTDISSGRFDIYEKIFEMIKIHPILGNGIGAISERLGIGAHNIYLMLVCEIGLLLGGYIIIIMVKRFLQTIVYIKRYKFNNNCKDFEKYIYGLAMQSFFLLYGLTGNGLTETSQFIVYLVFCAIVKENIVATINQEVGNVYF